MAGPGDEIAAGAGGLSRLRASYADRDQAIELLKAAFVQGRLAMDDLEVRVGQVLASRTYAELDAVTADIPAGVVAVPPRTRALARVLKPAYSTVNVIAWGAGVCTPLAVLLGVIAVLTGNATLLVLSIFAFTGAAGVAWGALAARASPGSRQHKDTIEQYEQALADQERMHGRDHPDTIAARATLASALRAAGKLKDAIGQYERVLADRERTSGPDHPDTIAARANLAFAYRSAGRLREAVPAYERTLADRERVQGRDHRDTLTARANLAACYQLARRLTEAIPAYKRALADSERMLGPGDIETLTTRCNLASAYYIVGRLADVVAVLQRALTDCERYLGPDHPMTQTVRENLDAAAQT
jgi:tetratricopeptide (TPR) repeat protein